MAVKKKKGSKSAGAGDLLRDETPDSDAFPGGIYLVKIKKCEVGETKSSNKKCFNMQAEITSPKEHKGRMLFPRFVIGDDADPEAKNRATWKTSFGAKRLRNCLLKAGVELAGSDDDLCEAIVGKKVAVQVVLKEQGEGPYKGELQNDFTKFFEPGERDAEITEDVPSSSKKKGRAVEEDDDEDDEDDEDDDEKETSKKKSKKKAPKKSKSKSKDDDDDDDDEEEDEEEDEDADDDEDEDDDESDDDDEEDEDEEDEETAKKKKTTGKKKKK